MHKARGIANTKDITKDIVIRSIDIPISIAKDFSIKRSLVAERKSWIVGKKTSFISNKKDCITRKSNNKKRENGNKIDFLYNFIIQLVIKIYNYVR